MSANPYLTHWYYDYSYQPICPSHWLDFFECPEIACPFSHSEYAGSIEIDMYEYLYADPNALCSYVKEYIEWALASRQEEMKAKQDFVEPDEKEVRRDMDKIYQLQREQLIFNQGHEIAKHGLMCPALVETGNCLFPAHCGMIHSDEDPRLDTFDKEGRWYPTSRECECCKGYIFACSCETQCTKCS
mmetsp:Transcript_8155/g.12013  ORF Transcript_8155/g.12013 Transcript_8155/m.12013 type:complete len:187 (-) Transcript_8155:942-1502(-)